MRIVCLIIGLLIAVPVFAAAPFDAAYHDGIYHIILKGERTKKRIVFGVSKQLITNKEAHVRSGAKLTINAGFFDHKNSQTVSYVMNESKTVADPITNENLISNPVLRQNLDKILNRTEFRILECDNKKYMYEIVPHDSLPVFGCKIVTSCQGGPLVYPQLRLEEEFFIVKNSAGKVVRESANVLHKTARTIIGLKGENEVHILIITDKNPMDLYDVYELCKKLGLKRAMAFDGGGSTSMDYLNEYSVVSESDVNGARSGRKLKSFMFVY